MLRFRALRCVTTLAIALATPSFDAHAQTAVPPPPPAERGRVTGRVLDEASGQPITGAAVNVVGTPLGALSDLDGRYTILAVPFGRHSLLVRRIGFQAKQIDSVAVTTTTATVVNFLLNPAAVELQAVVIRQTATTQSASQASLLAVQQHAASASDGVSAEQIKKTPDSNAGEAATRVSGLSLVDNKFVIARGLPERYSTTLVNGSEVASPEPTKKIVPLDIFPASLLESIIVTKSATPDKPGDFSGGAVEIRTKEFPENTVRSFSISQSYNSQATFQTLPFPSRRGLDYLGMDDGRRAAPYLPPGSVFEDNFAVERFAESIRNDWAPRPLRTAPNLGLSLNLGGQRPSERVALGYIVSLNYSAASEHQADRFFQFFTSPAAEPNRGFVYQDFRNTIDWGGVANLSLRLGVSSKFSIKNLYTRNAEELYSHNEGFSDDKNGDVRSFQFQYIERDLLQTQIAGEHLLASLGSSRLEWKATFSRSGRDEPDNRQVSYLRPDGAEQFALGSNSDIWFRSLDDRNAALQVDWQIPLTVRSRAVTLKAGGLLRRKDRHFDGSYMSFNPLTQLDLPNDLLTLPPEMLFTPENIGSYIGVTFARTIAQPYDVDDRLTAAFAMFDAKLTSRLRLVAGARMEDWYVDLFDGGRDLYTPGDSTKRPTQRRNRDILFSANANLALTERLAFRVAAFQSLARPDTRELSVDEYTDIVGSCATIGNPLLQRSTVLNVDTRLEWYPRPGEVISVSGFYKDFTDPIVRVVLGRSGCTYSYENAQSATNIGTEVDVRKDLTFLPAGLSRLSAGVNFTYVRTRVAIAPSFGVYDPDLTLEGQSPYLVNASLSYSAENGGLTATVLYNRFADRIVRYGFRSSGGEDATQGPNIVEPGRATLDAKLQRAFGERVSLSVSGKNLTNAPTRFVQTVSNGTVLTGFARPGTTLQVSVSYAR